MTRTYRRPDPRHLVLTMPGRYARSRTVRDQETALPACNRRPARQVRR